MALDKDKRTFTLEQARILAGFSQIELAKVLGMTEKTYIQYEKYRKIFRMDHARKFVKATGFHYDELIFFKDELQNICS